LAHRVMGTPSLRSAARSKLYLMFESHMPDRSGFPSAVRGVGAVRFGLPSGVRGTLGSRGFAHWPNAGEAMKRRIPAQPRTRRNVMRSSIHAKIWRPFAQEILDGH